MINNRSNFEAHNYDFNTSIYDHRSRDELIYSSRKNLLKLITLINRLFDYHSRILVVRIDLRYQKDIGQRIPLEVVQTHREQLFADRRSHPFVFDNLLSYAWGLERGEREGGYHYHLLAFYDGAYRRDDIGIAMAIRDLWGTITGGLGQCYISNFDKQAMALKGCLGIGMIHRDDVELRINLIENVAAYITKKCSIFDARSGRTETGQFRTFGRSQMPKPLDRTVPRRGRPPTSNSRL